MPSDTAAIWMSEAEIIELFGTTAGAVHTGIKAIFKENALHDYEVCKYVRSENGNGVFSDSTSEEFLPDSELQ